MSENKRQSLSKKMRFDVFKRDLFVCQYCDSSPPSVVLEVDHIIPVSKGGKNRVDNLITACFDCNRGKSDGSLNVAPKSILDKADVLAEKMAQLKAFDKLQREKRKLEEGYIDEVEYVFSSKFNRYFSLRFRNSVRRFLSDMTVFELMDAMNNACSRIKDPESAVKYFCGICWTIIKERDNGG